MMAAGRMKQTPATTNPTHPAHKYPICIASSLELGPGIRLLAPAGRGTCHEKAIGGGALAHLPLWRCPQRGHRMPLFRAAGKTEQVRVWERFLIQMLILRLRRPSAQPRSSTFLEENVASSASEPPPTIKRKIRPSSILTSVRASCSVFQSPFLGNVTIFVE